jgi:peptide deformylase
MRPRHEIEQEYTNIAAQYGDKLFKVTVLQKEIEQLFIKLATLNQEAASANNAAPQVDVSVDIPVMGTDPAQDEHEIQ